MNFNMFDWAHLRLFAAYLVAGLVLFAGPKYVNAATPPDPLPAASKVETKTEYVFERNIRPMLTADSANQLRTIAERYRRIIAEGGFPKVPRGSYQKGSDGKGVIALNRRLFMDGYVRVEATQGEFASIFTSATEDGVRRFQRNMGLAITGKVDQVTLAQLNVPAERRLITILANIDRLEVYGKDLGDRYLVVNIPGQQIETVSNGVVYSRHNAIVGRPSRPSPVVLTPLTDINFNPYWNAPASIVEADIIPKLRSGTRVLEDMNIRVFQGFGGPEVDPDSVNWRRAIADDYHFRQEPGPGNAMSTAKVNFKSPFGVYLHDTPEKHLFDSKTRFYSSGCVRVQDMPALVNWVLNGQDGIGEAQIATLGETLERLDVKLTTPPQLRQVYLTAWPVGDSVAFRHDIYELDGTGFTVGQPMPLGELSPDGQRYVLKPLPRLVQSIEDGNSDGFFLFSNRKKSGSFFGNTISEKDQKNKGGNATNTQRRLMARLAANSDDPFFASLYGEPAEPETAKKAVTEADDKKKKTKTATNQKARTKSEEVPGVFDWAKWRKEQAAKRANKDKDADKAKKSSAADKKAKPSAKDKKKTADKNSKKKGLHPAHCRPDDNGVIPAFCKTAEVQKKPKKKPTKAN